MSTLIGDVVKSDFTTSPIKFHPVPFFVTATSQSPGLSETLAAAYNPEMCLLALSVIKQLF